MEPETESSMFKFPDWAEINRLRDEYVTAAEAAVKAKIEHNEAAKRHRELERVAFSAFEELQTSLLERRAVEEKPEA